VIPPTPFNIDTGPFIYNVHYITNTSASPLCTTVTLHVVTEGTAVTNMQCSAFMAPFVAGDITNPARFLGDSGTSTANPPVDTTFQLTVPASTTIALVVLNVNVSPAGQGTVYQVILDQDIFCQQASPTPTATGTPSPTATATASSTPSPTATATPSSTGTPTPTPGSCISYEAESSNNTLTGGAVIRNCPTCSGGQRVGFVGNNSGTLQFNGVSAVAQGRYSVTISYTNGDPVRYALLSVNGNSGTPLSFPSTGSFQTVGSIQTTITLNTGNNTLEFYNPIVGSWAPDFDRIQFNCPGPTPTATPRPSVTPTATARPSATPTSTPRPTVTPTVTPTATPIATDFNRDGFPDSLLFNPSSLATVIWYLHNNVHVGSDHGPALPAGWNVAGVADFSGDGFPDLVLFNPNGGTRIWYLRNNDRIGTAAGPTLPGGWDLIGVADFNRDGHPDYLLFNINSLATVVWYMRNNVHIAGDHGPALPMGWNVAGLADFNGDGFPDLVLFNPNGGTRIWYLRNNDRIGTAAGPSIPGGWILVGVADFNRNGHPDFLLFNSITRRTVIWYMSNNVHVGSAAGPTLASGWDLVAP
jgi:hypothetical protein